MATKKETPEKLSLFQKLLKIQEQVKGLSKDKDGHQYKYVTGNKLLSFIKPIMDEHGILLKQEVVSIENTRQDYKVWDKWVDNGKGNPKGAWKDKNEILSKVMMKFTWVDCETGEKDENSFGANGQNDWEKGLGSALTYAERYFLLKYFHISTDEDDIDNPDRKKEESKVQKPESKTGTKKEAKPKAKENKEKQALSSIDALIKIIKQNDKVTEKAVNQLIETKYISKRERDLLANVLPKETLDKVEVR
jgi:hypothetical protein